jgi:hypothetical protein
MENLEDLESEVKKALKEWKDAVGRYEYADGDMLEHIAYDIKSKESKYILLLKQLKELKELKKTSSAT